VSAGSVLIDFQINPDVGGGGTSSDTPEDAAASLVNMFNDPESTLRKQPSMADVDPSFKPLVIAECPDGSFQNPCPGTDGGDDGLTDGEIAGIIVACCGAFLIVVSYCLYARWWKPRAAARKAGFRGVELAFDDPAAGGHGHGGASGHDRDLERGDAYGGGSAAGASGANQNLAGHLSSMAADEAAQQTEQQPTEIEMTVEEGEEPVRVHVSHRVSVI